MADNITSGDTQAQGGADEQPPKRPEIHTGYLQFMLESSAKLSEDAASNICELVQKWLPLHSSLTWLDAMFSECESPMEREFLDGLHAAFREGSGLVTIRSRPYLGWDVTSASGLQLRLIPQWDVFDYEDSEDVPFARVDFCLFSVTCPLVKLAIEIDGHEFHEKTKEQAQRDKARDRKLTKAGYQPLRFTGSEVYADSVSSGREVLSILESMIDRVDLEFYDRHALAATEEVSVAALDAHGEPAPQAAAE